MIARLTYAAVAVLALAAAVWWARSDAYRDGERAERAVWVKRQADAERAQREANERERARHERITATYRAHLADIAAGRDDFARRLRVALSRSATPRECPGGTADGAPESGGEGEGGGAAADLAGALADYDAACRADAEQLRALIRAVQP